MAEEAIARKINNTYFPVSKLCLFSRNEKIFMESKKANVPVNALKLCIYPEGVMAFPCRSVGNMLAIIVVVKAVITVLIIQSHERNGGS